MRTPVSGIGPALQTGVLLWLSAVVYMIPLKKKKNFHIGLILTGLLGAAGSPVLNLIGFTDMQRMLVLLLHYLYAVLCFGVCTRLESFAVWYCGIWAMLTQQFLWEISYELTAYIERWGKGGMKLVCMAGLFGVGYGAVFLTIARWMPEQSVYKIGPRQIFSGWLLWSIFQMLYVMEHLYDGNTTLNLLAQFYCMTLLYLQNVLFKKSKMQQELDTIQVLWHQQKEQYQISRETIELINHKCHDLKHQMKAMYMLQDGAAKEAYLRELEESVEIYSAIVKTGNEILDTILTEKSLVCEKNGIHINCVANGEMLSFMDPVDLYTMFGNALDNAIESLKHIEEREKRLIDIMIYVRQKILVIQIVNPVSGKLKFEEGLPVTTKAQNGYHGFGLKSIRHTIQKYDGYLTVETKNGCFYLKMIAPIPESGTE